MKKKQGTIEAYFVFISPYRISLKLKDNSYCSGNESLRHWTPAEIFEQTQCCVLRNCLRVSLICCLHITLTPGTIKLLLKTSESPTDGPIDSPTDDRIRPLIQVRVIWPRHLIALYPLICIRLSIGASIPVATKRLYQIDRCDGDGDGDGDNVSVRGPYSIASCFFSAN